MISLGSKHTFALLTGCSTTQPPVHSGNQTTMKQSCPVWNRNGCGFLSASTLSQANLEQERRSIQGLVSDISHQVKTPIANLRLYEDILEERLDGDDRELVRHLIRETELLEFLIHSLVKISRLESGTIQLSPEIQPLSPLLADAQERVESKRIKKNVTLDSTGQKDNIFACFDRKWTAEALYNILDNAVKYTPPGGTVTVRTEEYPMFVRIRIADQGPGVTEDEIPHLFERFYRSPRFHEKEGVGLGLYLSREIIRKEGGYIRVCAMPGQSPAASEAGHGARVLRLSPKDRLSRYRPQLTVSVLPEIIRSEILSKLSDLRKCVERLLC